MKGTIFMSLCVKTLGTRAIVTLASPVNLCQRKGIGIQLN